MIKKILAAKIKPDGILASVEKIAIQIYMASQETEHAIPEELKVIAFSTLETASILNPSYLAIPNRFLT